MTAYYNEIDPYAAQWLRDLIAAGHIAPGDVDERSIEDVRPDDLRPYTQCHFFAGIGIWSRALRRTGVPDDFKVWTGSCPCQPFSAAGKGGGVEDERHLWPAWQHLIRECRPALVLGEQVASSDGLGWLDLVQTDMEGEGYAFAPFDLCAAGVTVGWEESQAGEWLRRAICNCTNPWIAGKLRDFAAWAGGNIGEGGHHVRQRIYFVGELGESEVPRRQRQQMFTAGSTKGMGESRGQQIFLGETGRSSGQLADLQYSEQWSGGGTGGESSQRNEPRIESSRCSATGILADNNGPRGASCLSEQNQRQEGDSGKPDYGSGEQRREQGTFIDTSTHASHLSGNLADWLYCRDGRWRAVEPSTFPLAHAAASRVGRLRAYGNGLDSGTVEMFLKAYLQR